MHGYVQDKQRYLAALKRVEGQVRGLQRMIEDDEYCIDVLAQVAAVTGALQRVAVGLVDDHVQHCVSDALAGDDPALAREKVSEATDAVARLLRVKR